MYQIATVSSRYTHLCNYSQRDTMKLRDDILHVMPN